MSAPHVPHRPAPARKPVDPTVCNERVHGALDLTQRRPGIRHCKGKVVAWTASGRGYCQKHAHRIAEGK